MQAKTLPTHTQQPWQVCSLYLQVNPAKFNAVQTALLNIDNSEIPASQQATGKIILLLSSNQPHQFIDDIESIKDIDGVLSVSLVYHQQDDEDLF